MYKTLLLSLLSVVVATGAFAQQDAGHVSSTGFSKDHFYLRAGLGYASPQCASTVDYSLTGYKVKKISVATGLNEQLGIGYNLNDYISVELDGSLFSGNKKYTYGENEANLALGQNTITQVSVQGQSLVLLMPGIVLHTAPARLSAYTRLSVVLPVTSSFNYSTNNTVDLSSETVKFRSRFALGFNTAAGLSYKISPRLCLWAEASALSLTPNAKKGTVTAYTQGGTNQLNIITQPVTAYGTHGTYGYTTSPTSAETQFGTNPTATFPFSNMGCQAGITLNVGGKKTPAADVPRLERHWYLKAGVGYALPAFSSTTYERTSNSVNAYNNTTGASVYTANFKDKPYTYSAGLSGTIGAGYMMGRHFGLELDADVRLTSPKYTASDHETLTGYTNAGDYYTTVRGHATIPGVLMPSFVMQTGGKVVNLYSRVGLALTVDNKQYTTANYSSTYSVNDAEVENITSTTKFTPGYTAAAGVSYRITQRLQLWGEVNALSYNPTVKQETTVDNSIQGVTSDQYNLHSSGTYNANSSLSNDAPAFKLSYSNVGVKVGVAFAL